MAVEVRIAKLSRFATISAHRAERLYDQGRRAAAIKEVEYACHNARTIVNLDPANREWAQFLGVMLYNLARWQAEDDDRASAVENLKEAEGAYQSLGTQDADERAELAEVLALRAVLHAERGRVLSAVSDAQEAVWAATGGTKTGEDGYGPLPPRSAGVPALVGYAILLVGGDPILALTATVTALRGFSSPGFTGGTTGLEDQDAYAMLLATRVYHAVTTGRGEETGAHQGLLTSASLDGVSPPDSQTWALFDDLVSRVRSGQPSLGEALHTAGRDDLARRLTGTRQGTGLASGILVPGMRGEPADLPRNAAVLAALAEGSARALPDRRLLLLESHALYLQAAKTIPSEQSEQDGFYRGHGASLTGVPLAAGRLLAALGEENGALDAIDWLTETRTALAWYLDGDPALRDITVEGLRWSRDVHAARRSGESRRRAREFTRELARLGDP